MKRGLYILAGLLLAAVLAFLYDYVRFINTPVELGDESVRLEVVPGATLRSVATELQQRQILSRPLYWRIHARLTGQANRIKLGEYALPNGITPARLLEQLVSGVTVQYRLTLLEGWTYAQIVEAIKAHPQIKQTLSDEDYAAIMDTLGHAGMNPEGWFYPDTYSFPKGTTDAQFLRRAYHTMKTYLDEAWATRDAGVVLKTPYEALILASIVEKETGAPEERSMIAAVFLSRLKKGMRLQTDPTVIYGMGERYRGNIRKSDLLKDTPYNTYTRAGLPPTPIASPGGDAIDAVLHPADTRALYFVARGGGRHHFSETYEEHRRAVIKYLLGGNERRYQGRP